MADFFNSVLGFFQRIGDFLSMIFGGFQQFFTLIPTATQFMNTVTLNGRIPAFIAPFLYLGFCLLLIKVVTDLL